MRPLYDALEKTNKANFVASENSIAARKAAAQPSLPSHKAAAPQQRERIVIAPDPEFAA